MSTFEQTIEKWLSRKTPNRDINVCHGLPVILATDIGAKRNENQDRVAALHIGSRTSAGRPTVAIVVSDGMGGMREGAKSAELAIAGFFFGLVEQRGKDTEGRIKSAVLRANGKINALFQGNGGATLSAIIVDHQSRTWIVNVGDSRIYGYGNGKKVERLTVDDSFKEAVGGHGRELLQFMGMGEGIQPHISELPNAPEIIAITTDGAHEIDQGVFENVLRNSTSTEQAAKRIIDVALWCGGCDNASAALIDHQKLISTVYDKDVTGIQVWDPHGALTIIWAKDEVTATTKAQKNDSLDVIPESKSQEHKIESQPDPLAKKPSPRSSQKKKPEKKQIELDIEIESHRDSSNDSK